MMLLIKNDDASVVPCPGFPPCVKLINCRLCAWTRSTGILRACLTEPDRNESLMQWWGVYWLPFRFRSRKSVRAPPISRPNGSMLLSACCQVAAMATSAQCYCVILLGPPVPLCLRRKWMIVWKGTMLWFWMFGARIYCLAGTQEFHRNQLISTKKKNTKT